MYTVETTDKFDKTFNKLDPYIRKLLRAWIEKNLVGCTNPKALGKALTGNHKGQWRYRIGDYRLICEIKDDELIILAITVGHRSSNYLHEEEKIEQYGR